MHSNLLPNVDTVLTDLDSLSFLLNAENLARLLKNAAITIRNQQYEIALLKSERRLSFLQVTDLTAVPSDFTSLT